MPHRLSVSLFLCLLVSHCFDKNSDTICLTILASFQVEPRVNFDAFKLITVYYENAMVWEMAPKKKSFLGYSNRQPQPSPENLVYYPLDQSKSKRLGWKWPMIIIRHFLQSSLPQNILFNFCILCIAHVQFYMDCHLSIHI